MSMRSTLLSAALLACLGAPMLQAQSPSSQTMTIASAFEQSEQHHGALFTLDVMLGTYAIITGMNELWRFDEAGALKDRAGVAVEEGDVTIAWSNGEHFTVAQNTPLEVRFSGETSPLALQIRTLLNGALFEPIADLPKNTVFDASGSVVGSNEEPIGQWSLINTHSIALHLEEQDSITVPLADILSALKKRADL